MAKCNEVTEVFQRITGYYRPVKNWNKGKQEEFKDRVSYNVERAAGECPKNK